MNTEAQDPKVGRILRRIDVKRVLVILAASLIAAYPFNTSRTYPIRAIENINDDALFTACELQPVSGNIVAPTSALSSGAFITKLTGLELTPMPVRVCLVNETRVPQPLDKIVQREIAEEGLGGMAISVMYPDLPENISIYTKMGQRTCVDLLQTVSKSEIVASPEVKNMYLQSADGATSTSILDLRDSRIEVQVKLDWFQYAKNVLILFVAFSVLTQVLEWTFIRRKTV